MTRVYLDTNVLVYATGDDSPHREPCRAILRAVAERRVAGETSAYAVQEFVRQRRRRGDPEAVPRARSVMEVCTEIHPVDRAVLLNAIEEVERHPALDIADAVHVATALIQGIARIVCADRGLDGIPGLQRLDPLNREWLASLTSD